MGGRAVNARWPVRLVMLLLTVMFMMVLRVQVDAEERYSISEKDAVIKLNPDGSADVTEQIVFAMKGSVNNLVMEIDKPEMGEVQLKRVVSYGLKGPLECRPLESGQWDPTVFSGTYSVFDESDRMKVKVYYSFGKFRSRFTLVYHVTHAARRYLDVGDLTFRSVTSEWPTRVDNIHVRVVLPAKVDPGETDAFIRGVFVGKSALTEKRMLDFNVPDTVPGEELTVRVLFPADQIPDVPLSGPLQMREVLQKEEQQLRQEGMEPALHAREQAAQKAGERAFAIILNKRATDLAAILCYALTLAGLTAAFLLSMHVRNPKPIVPTAPKMEMLQDNPWMIRMLLHRGKLDSRGLMAALLQACEAGRLRLLHVPNRQGKPILAFKPIAGKEDGGLPETQTASGWVADGYSKGFDDALLSWVRHVADSDGYASFEKWTDISRDESKAHIVHAAWNGLCEKAEDAYARCGFSTRIHARIRLRALAAGMLLFGAGLMLGVALSLWQGYLLLVPGTWLVLYGTMAGGYTSRAIGFRALFRKLRRQLGRRHRHTASFEVLVPMGQDGAATTMERQYVRPSLSMAVALGVEGPFRSDDMAELERSRKTLRDALLNAQD